MTRHPHDDDTARIDDGTEDATLQGAARSAIVRHIKARARWYARRPMAMEPLYPGLASADATTLVAIAEHLVEREGRSPRRWFGFGGEVSLINARAALLLGRTRRRHGDALERQRLKGAGNSA